jgi:glycosyltransferase involved in cell wall biosynthesis
MKAVNIISSLMGAGLHREALLLKELLESYGHTVRLMHYTDGANAPMERADISIFLEVVMPAALTLASENWLAPNCEWWPEQNDQYLPHFTKIICKTRDCYDIWSAKVGRSKCVFTSFEARDLYRPDVPRENRFLHVAGKSASKGTAAVLSAWQMIPNQLPPLTVVASNAEFKIQWEQNHSNISFFQKVDEPELIRLMNSHKVHIMPSPYEGFGHAQHEGTGCGASVITMAAPPFIAPDHDTKGTQTGMFPVIPPAGFTKQRLAQMARTTPNDVRDACHYVFNMMHDCVYNQSARVYFLENREFFRRTFMQLVGDK